MTNPQPTNEDRFWGTFFAATIALYCLVMVIIPLARYLIGAF